MSDGIDRSDTFWYKDAVIYQVHVKSYFDSNSDGYGDLPGLIEKLDYIQDLGVDCIWLLPFYPSPMRDDGYDIADYEGINPIYGTIDDFSRLLREAHARGIRVITELVINHTSDQHRWFQLARNSPPNSPERNFYVWSETENKYQDARIIFVDFEKSNWTFDQVAQSYYWHRFFYHQPDLNYDNPAVFESITKIMLKWLEMGVDGLRLDAIPYLVEREDTNCENLPETHKVLKDMRRIMDKHHEDRIFLAEANQWPTDVRQYFGDGDECHMAFHFPVMPRLFMAVHLEDRHPITDILRETPPIPENCQWGIFLRNHDELTLEMVTDSERDYMYTAYAKNPLMKINVGIRRRLAPLLEYSRPRIELLNSFLFSLPGTPIVYYGDEIGMGENIYLNDRNGVRTPMQWNSDRNAGFSKALFAQLYSPPIMDPLGGFQSTNVEAQQLDPSSLLNWMKSIVKLRKKHKVFGRGSITVLTPENRKIFAYIRRYNDEIVLCVANLSRHPQSVALELSEYEGIVPTELFGLGSFHQITKEPYIVTLGPYNFYWLALSFSKDSIPNPAPPDLVEAKASDQALESLHSMRIMALEPNANWDTILTGTAKHLLETDLLPAYICKQRWYGKKTEAIASVKIIDYICIPVGEDRAIGLVTSVESASGDHQQYMLYLAIARGTIADELLQQNADQIVAYVRAGTQHFVIHDALANEPFCLSMLALIDQQQTLASSESNVLSGQKSSGYTKVVSDRTRSSVKLLSSEQSNSSVILGSEAILKLYRRVQTGINPDYDMGVYLREKTTFKNTPMIAGAISYQSNSGKESFTAGLLQQFVANQGDGWSHSVAEFRRFYERAVTHKHLLEHLQVEELTLKQLVTEPIPRAAIDLLGIYLTEAETLGRRVGEMHLAVGQPTEDPNFKPEFLDKKELQETADDIERLLNVTLTALTLRKDSLSEQLQLLTNELNERQHELVSIARNLATDAGSLKKIRCHGDLHLGQVLNVFGDWLILDFEGEPSRSMNERRKKHSPMKDVAGMLRSFSYAAYASLFLFTHNHPEELKQFFPWAKACEMWSSVAFLQGYLEVTKGHDIVPADHDELFRVLTPFIIDKAFYELDYEMNNRPDWLGIPLVGIVHELRAGLLK